ncbi:MAG: permease-like cell division protein FtsX [Microbacterium sp.]
MRFRLVLGEALQGLRRNISMVISIVLVTFVSLTFVGAAALMQLQIVKTNDYFEDRAQVDIYLCSSLSTVDTCTDGAATDEQIQAVKDELEGDTLKPFVQEYQYLSAEDAYNALPDSMTNAFTADQWSGEFHVRLVNPQDSDVITEAFSGFTGVEEVTDQLSYLDPLFGALTIATYIAVGIAVLMLISTVLLVSTTIRLSAYARRREVSIMRLVGASNRFIQTPFVLEGVFAAFIGSALASAAIVLGAHYGIAGYLSKEGGGIPWVGDAQAWLVVPWLVVIGVVLAAISAGFAIRRWLKA